MNLVEKEVTVSTFKMSLKVVIGPGHGKELEYSWHIFLESFFFRALGLMCDGKDGPEGANFAEGSLTIALLGFWTRSC